VRVLLINPRATYANEIAQKCYPPLNLLYLGRALLDAGQAVTVLDANALALPDEQILEKVRAAAPTLIGIPLYTEIMSSVHALAAKLHLALPDAKIVLGGAHASALPGETLEAFDMASFVLRGYAERGIVELCEAMSGTRAMDTVNGLTWRDEGNIRENKLEPLGSDLDAVGAPARELVADMYDQKRYYTLLVRERPVDTLVTSRGCPFSCHFCYNQDHRYRVRSADAVMEEIASIVERGIHDIEIVDDTFTVNRDRATDILDRLIKEKMGVSFRIKSRVDVMDEELVRKAKDAGVYMISYGMESADDAMLERMCKGITAEANAHACQITKQAGIACHTSWIIGFPGETPESIQKTTDFIIREKPTTAQIALLRPYPQTEAYRIAKDEGMLRGEWTLGSDEYPWIQLPWVRDRAHLESVLQKAVRKIYFRPYYVAQFGKMILGGMNATLARYAFQEFRKTVRNALRPGAKRSGSV
jgi:radical SAM superfamily enzyme YgiQ (UPF0313 family)